MRAAARRSVALAIAGAAVLLSHAAAAQTPAAPVEPAAASAGATSSEAPEEITVRAPRTLMQYRLEFEQARDELVDIFNEENKGEDNDVTCRDERPTGSRVPRRTCRSSAQERAEALSAREFLTELLFASSRPGGASSTQGATASGAARSRTERSRVEIETELRRLATENPKVFRAAVKYVEAEDAYREARTAGAQGE
jgi:hypothetical protein